MKTILLLWLCFIASARSQDALAAYDYSSIGKNRMYEWVLDGKKVHDAYVQLMKPTSAVIVSKEGSQEYSYEHLSEPMRLVCDQLRAEAGQDPSKPLDQQIGAIGGRKLIGKVVSVVPEGVIVDASEFALSSTDAVPMIDVCYIGRGLMDNRWTPPALPAAWYLLKNYARAKSVQKDDIVGIVVYPRNGTFSYMSLVGQQTLHVVSPFPEQAP